MHMSAVPLVRSFRPLAEMTCSHCGVIVLLREGAIFTLLDATGHAYCGRRCAASAGVWPWAGILLPDAAASRSEAGAAGGLDAPPRDQTCAAPVHNTRARRLFGEAASKSQARERQ